MRSRLTALALMATGFSTTGCSAQDAGVQDTSDQNQQVVLAMVEALNARDMGALDSIVAPDVQRHSAATPNVTVRSRDDFKAFLRRD